VSAHGPGAIGRSGATLAVLLVALPVAGAVAVTTLGISPLVLPAAALALAGLAAVPALLRRHGTLGPWLAAIALSLLAGEMSAIPLGGQSGRLLWADAVVLGGAALALARGGMGWTMPRGAVLSAALPWLAWAALTLLVARDPLTAVAELKEWIVALIVLIAAAGWVDGRPERARGLLQVVACAAVLIGIAMIHSALTSPLGWVLAVLLKKVDLSWGRTNYLAGLLILGIPVTVGLLAAADRHRARGFLLLALALQAAGLALSASKGAILALVAAFLVGFVPSSRAVRWAALAMMAILAAGVALFLVGPLAQVVAYRLQESAIAYSVGERMDLYRLAWDSFLSRPLWGVGINNFSVVANRLTGVDTVPHNLELGLLAECGLPGTLLALAWVAAFARLAWAARDPRQPAPERALGLGVWTAFLGFLLHNQTESTLYGEQYKILLMLIAAAALGLAPRLPHDRPRPVVHSAIPAPRDIAS
jgi:O-antigen ligase